MSTKSEHIGNRVLFPAVTNVIYNWLHLMPPGVFSPRFFCKILIK